MLRYNVGLSKNSLQKKDSIWGFQDLQKIDFFEYEFGRWSIWERNVQDIGNIGKRQYLLHVEFQIQDTYKEYKKITQTISHWLASVGGITAIFLSGFQMFFGGMINFIWTVRFLSRDSPPSGYSKTSYKKKMKNLGTDPNDPANKMATKASTKDGKANLNKNQDNDKRLSFWETFKLYCIRSPLFRWICCCCVGQKRQADLSEQLSHYQKSR